MIAFPADSRRDLKVNGEAASMARPVAAAAGKKVEAGASEGRPAGKKVEAGASEGRSAGKKMEETTTALKKMEETTAKPVDSLWKEGEMLRLRKEHFEAGNRYNEMRRKYHQLTVEERRKYHQLTVEERKMPAVDDNKKKKKLVRAICSDAFIDFVIKNHRTDPDLSAKEIKKSPRRHREGYKMIKLVNAKRRAYYQALIDQHRAFGFAYDELEVTDDDDDDDQKEVTDDQEEAAAVVVKN